MRIAVLGVRSASKHTAHLCASTLSALLLLLLFAGKRSCAATEDSSPSGHGVTGSHWERLFSPRCVRSPGARTFFTPPAITPLPCEITHCHTRHPRPGTPLLSAPESRSRLPWLLLVPPIRPPSQWITPLVPNY